MHILYLHQYFTPPDGSGSTRSYEMARRLVKAGHRVTLVTSDAFFPASYRFNKQITGLSIDGIELKVIRARYSNRQSYCRRILAFFYFALLASLVAVRISNVQIVFATSTPLTIMIPGVIAKRVKRVPMVFEVRDQWPKVPIALGILKNPAAIFAASSMERIAYREAAHIIALSPATAQGIYDLGIPQSKVSVVPNSADTELFRVPPETGQAFIKKHPYLASRTIAVYAGTLGYANGVDYLIRLAAVMAQRQSNVAFVIVGDGAKRESLISLAEDMNVLGRNVWILPPLAKRDVPPLLAAASVVCSTFIKDAAPWPNSANKFFDGLAAGKPLAINYFGWQKQVLEHSGAGIVLDPDDTHSAATTLGNFLNDDDAQARAAAASAHLGDTQFNRCALASKLRLTLEHVAHNTNGAVTSQPHDFARPISLGGSVAQPGAKKVSLFRQRQ